MAASYGRGLRPGSVVRALGRLLLLIGFGFSAGLIIGVLSEEPELLVGHLRGESEAIVLTPTAEDAQPVTASFEEEDVQLAAVDRELAMKPRPEEIAEQSIPEVAAPRAMRAAAPGRAGDWAIQVGAFSDERAASRLAERLRGKGYPTELLAASGDAQRWRVRVQPVRSEADAKQMAVQLKRVERLPTWVLPMEGRSRP